MSPFLLSTKYALNYRKICVIIVSVGYGGMMMNHWFFLFLAIGFEVSGTLSVKKAAMGNSYLWASLVVLLYSVSFLFLGLAVKKMEISTAYAIWSAMGTAVITILGFMIFNESLNIYKIFGILMIIGGVVILKLQQ
jgi:small multidrug resistance pump